LGEEEEEEGDTAPLGEPALEAVLGAAEEEEEEAEVGRPEEPGALAAVRPGPACWEEEEEDGTTMLAGSLSSRWNAGGPAEFFKGRRECTGHHKIAMLYQPLGLISG